MYNTIVWIVEAFLAAFFLAAGVPKLIGRGLDRWAGFSQVPRAMTTLIGCCEVLAAVGLVLPLLVGRVTWLVPLAALGIMVITLMACGFHLRSREWLAAVGTALWALLASGVAAARWGEFATGPAVSKPDVLGPLLIVVVLGILASLGALNRAGAAPRTATARTIPAVRSDGRIEKDCARPLVGEQRHTR